MQQTNGIQLATPRADFRPTSIVGAGQTAGILPPLARSRSARDEERERVRLRRLSTRILNVLVASFLILLTLPLMLVIAVAVKLSSPGSVLYAQDRVGLNRRQGDRRRRGFSRPKQDRRASDRGGHIFRIYKFRTMRPATNHENAQVWAAQSDPRITRVGHFLRAHRLDELPQLFNVLLGDMNLVGPRPEQPEIFEELRRTIDLYSKRQDVRPGITGWAQVNHKYDESITDVRKKLHYDLDYVKRQSVAKDLHIMVKTPSVMLFKQGSQ